MDVHLPFALVFGTIFEKEDRLLNSDGGVFIVWGAPLEGWQLSQDILNQLLIGKGHTMTPGLL